MRKILAGALLLSSAILPALAQQRPKITGISYVRFYSTDRAGVQRLYAEHLGLAKREEGGMDVYLVGNSQRIEIDPAPRPTPDQAMLEEIGFETDNPAALEKYLRAHNVVTKKIANGITLTDRVQPRISFIKRRINPKHDTAREVSNRIIHAGFIVKDRKTEDPLFLDTLGFKPYWYGNSDGGANPNWVSLQTPDAHEWVEYMLRNSDHPSRRTLGVMYHVSLGVVNMKDAVAKLKQNGYVDPKQGTNLEPNAGLDGKWQYNIYDPDESRVELMEFAPFRTPCCSAPQQPPPSPTDR
jgi:hypothetical protein